MQSLNIEYIYQKMYRFIVGGFSTENSGFLNTADSVLTFILSIVALFFIIVILYVIARRYEIRKENAKKLHEPQKTKIEPYKGNDRWQKVLEHIHSPNSSDWRLAIIEADNILDEMVTRIGLKGDNLGDKLKSIEISDFDTLNEAWEAHKVRNRIAHEGLDFKIDHREAKRVISLFEKVFKEFDYI